MTKIEEPAPVAVVVPAISKRQKARSIAIAAGLVFLVILFYLITIFKLGGSVVNRTM